MERERRLLILILLDTQRGEGGGNVIIPKRVESSTAPSESTVHFISTTLIEGHDELQGAGLYQRKVKFTSRTPVCIFSSRIKYQLNSVNYSRCLVYWVFQWLDHRPAVFITHYRAFLFPNSIVRWRVPRRALRLIRLYIDYFFKLPSPV